MLIRTEGKNAQGRRRYRGRIGRSVRCIHKARRAPSRRPGRNEYSQRHSPRKKDLCSQLGKSTALLQRLQLDRCTSPERSPWSHPTICGVNELKFLIY